MRGVYGNVIQNAGLTVDGHFGDDTRAAVVVFQQTHGLTDDGIAGPGTTKKMESADLPSVQSECQNGKPQLHFEHRRKLRARQSRVESRRNRVVWRLSQCHVERGPRIIVRLLLLPVLLFHGTPCHSE